MTRGSLTAQSRALAKRLEAIPSEVLAELRPALIQAGEDVADNMKALAEASRDTGALITSIMVTGPGETTPAYSSDGGKCVAKGNQVLITVGNSTMRHGYLIEFGTKTASARPRVMARLSRTITKAIKTAGGR